MEREVVVEGHVSYDAMFEQVTKARRKLSVKLSNANKTIHQLDRELERQDNTVKELYTAVGALQTELASLCAFVDEVLFNAEHLRNKEQFMQKTGHLAGRMKALSAGLEAQLEAVDDMSLRAVPIKWVGVAEDVRVMGTFDGWTRGEQLSPEEYTGTFTEFSGELKVRPGAYEIKFLVDDEYRLAPDWPTTCDDPMTANNVLVVE